MISVQEPSVQTTSPPARKHATSLRVPRRAPAASRPSLTGFEVLAEDNVLHSREDDTHVGRVGGAREVGICQWAHHGGGGGRGGGCGSLRTDSLLGFDSVAVLRRHMVGGGLHVAGAAGVGGEGCLETLGIRLDLLAEKVDFLRAHRCARVSLRSRAAACAGRRGHER
jgi:hypothetical protein